MTTRGTTGGVTWEVARHRLDSRLEIQFTSHKDGVFEGHIATRLELAPAAISALRAALRADREARTVGWAVRSCTGKSWSGGPTTETTVRTKRHVYKARDEAMQDARSWHKGATVVRLLRRRPK